MPEGVNVQIFSDNFAEKQGVVFPGFYYILRQIAEFKNFDSHTGSQVFPIRFYYLRCLFEIWSICCGNRKLQCLTSSRNFLFPYPFLVYEPASFRQDRLCLILVGDNLFRIGGTAHCGQWSVYAYTISLQYFPYYLFSIYCHIQSFPHFSVGQDRGIVLIEKYSENTGNRGVQNNAFFQSCIEAGSLFWRNSSEIFYCSGFIGFYGVFFIWIKVKKDFRNIGLFSMVMAEWYEDIVSRNACPVSLYGVYFI